MAIPSGSSPSPASNDLTTSTCPSALASVKTITMQINAAAILNNLVIIDI
jgi:hypothetical protein